MGDLTWNIVFLIAGIIFGGWMMCAQPLHAQTYHGSHPPSNYGGQYHGLPDTIGQAVDQEIMMQTQEMERSGYIGRSQMSQDEIKGRAEYRSIQDCETFKVMLWFVTLGLSTLYNCDE